MMSRLRGSIIAGAGLVLAGCVGGTPEPATAPYPESEVVEVTATNSSVAPIIVRWQVGDGFAAATCAVRTIGGRIAKQSGDTIWFRTIERLEPVASPTPADCGTKGTATVVASRDAVQVVHIVPASVTKQVVGSVIFAAAVGATILLIVSAADGIIDAVGRWF